MVQGNVRGGSATVRKPDAKSAQSCFAVCHGQKIKIERVKPAPANFGFCVAR
jgi:hypothetical protein